MRYIWAVFFCSILCLQTSGFTTRLVQLSVSEVITDSPQRLEYAAKAFEVLYSTEHSIPLWSKYYLPDVAAGVYFSGPRPAQYQRDPRNIGHKGEAFGTGFDRGHLVPAEDMRSWGEDAFLASFYTTNILPMAEGLNRGAWAVLESRGRAIAKGNGGVLVYAGAYFDSGTPRKIGEVSIPSHVWKVFAWTDSADSFQMKCWMIPNTNITVDDLPNFEIELSTLLSKINISLEGKQGLQSSEIRSKTTLAQAIGTGDISKVQDYISTSIGIWNEIESTDDLGRNAVHLAAISGNDKIADLVLSKSLSAWSLLEVEDDLGRLPIHYGAMSGSSELLEVLMRKSLSVWKLLEHADSEGRIPLHYAARAGRVNAVEKLLERALSSYSMKRKQDKSGVTPGDMTQSPEIKALLD